MTGDPTQLQAEFFIDAEVDAAASRLAGYQIERHTEMIRLTIPGVGGHYGSELVRRVDDAARQQWPREYAGFRASLVAPVGDEPPEERTEVPEPGDEIARLWRLVGALTQKVEVLGERLGRVELTAAAGGSMPVQLSLAGGTPRGLEPRPMLLPGMYPQQPAPPATSALDALASRGVPRRRLASQAFAEAGGPETELSLSESRPPEGGELIGDLPAAS
jgi:hypothetical protein